MGPKNRNWHQIMTTVEKRFFRRLTSLIQLGLLPVGLIQFVLLLASAGFALAENEDCRIEEVPRGVVIAEARRIVDLVAVFSPENARDRFLQAKESMVSPARESFEENYLGTELKAIQESGISQSFELNEGRVDEKVIKDFNLAVVLVPGSRSKTLGSGKAVVEGVAYYVKMTSECPSGRGVELKVSEFTMRKVDAETLAREAEAVSMPKSRPPRATNARTVRVDSDAYGDLILAFKNEIESLKREVKSLREQVESQGRELKELRERK